VERAILPADQLSSWSSGLKRRLRRDKFDELIQLNGENDSQAEAPKIFVWVVRKLHTSPFILRNLWMEGGKTKPLQRKNVLVSMGV